MEKIDSLYNQFPQECLAFKNSDDHTGSSLAVGEANEQEKTTSAQGMEASGEVHGASHLTVFAEN